MGIIFTFLILTIISSLIIGVIIGDILNDICRVLLGKILIFKYILSYSFILIYSIIWNTWGISIIFNNYWLIIMFNVNIFFVCYILGKFIINNNVNSKLQSIVCNLFDNKYIIYLLLLVMIIEGIIFVNNININILDYTGYFDIIIFILEYVNIYLNNVININDILIYLIASYIQIIILVILYMYFL